MLLKSLSALPAFHSHLNSWHATQRLLALTLDGAVKPIPESRVVSYSQAHEHYEPAISKFCPG